MNTPEDLRYSSDHEWARRDGNTIRIGITDYAQDALGDVVYLEAPAVGATVAGNDKISEVESTKSVSDIYAPVAGTIVEVNAAVVENPQLLNEDPYGAGWICAIELADGSDFDALLDAAGYVALIEG